MKDLCIVAADVGNSAVKLALRLGDAWADCSIPFSAPDWEQSAIGWVRTRVDGNDSLWRLASVRDAAAAKLIAAIDSTEPSASIQRVSHRDIPMSIDVDAPECVGIDRLLSAFAACVQASPPAVVIDAGSAVTVDWVSQQGSFAGGAILPGLGLQSRILSEGAEALPAIDWNSATELRLPARNTADAIRSGILAGLCESLDGLIQQYCDLAGLRRDAVQVVLSGGDAESISRHLQSNHRLIPNLVCHGLLDLPRSMVG